MLDQSTVCQIFGFMLQDHIHGSVHICKVSSVILVKVFLTMPPPTEQGNNDDQAKRGCNMWKIVRDAEGR